MKLRASGPKHSAERSTGRSYSRLFSIISKRHLLELAGVCIAIVIPLAIAVNWYKSVSSGSPGGKPVVVSVSSGETADDVVNTLARDGVVTDTLAMHVYLVLHGTPDIQVGMYRFFKDEPFARILSRLDQGPNIGSIEVQPGDTFNQVAVEITQVDGASTQQFKGALLHAISTNPVAKAIAPSGLFTGLLLPEGMIGTGTYIFLPGESIDTLASQMVARLVSDMQKVGLIRDAASLGITPYQALTVASLVQWEGVYKINMPKVARVIYNRLDKGMKLQLDATVLYALGRSSGAVTHSNLTVQSPYNTYLHAGLPPTPIAIPSMDALYATMHPASGAWLYFVVVSQSGREAFADTFSQQLANEKIAQENGIS